MTFGTGGTFGAKLLVIKIDAGKFNDFNIYDINGKHISPYDFPKILWGKKFQIMKGQIDEKNTA